jgi:hypothetical protein
MTAWPWPMCWYTRGSFTWAHTGLAESCARNPDRRCHPIMFERVHNETIERQVKPKKVIYRIRK